MKAKLLTDWEFHWGNMLAGGVEVDVLKTNMANGSAHICYRDNEASVEFDSFPLEHLCFTEGLPIHGDNAALVKAATLLAQVVYDDVHEHLNTDYDHINNEIREKLEVACLLLGEDPAEVLGEENDES